MVMTQRHSSTAMQTITDIIRHVVEIFAQLNLHIWCYTMQWALTAVTFNSTEAVIYLDISQLAQLVV